MAAGAATLACRHGETFEGYPAGYAVCAVCCTPYQKGGYGEHCASSPSHLGEIAERARDRRHPDARAYHAASHAARPDKETPR